MSTTDRVSSVTESRTALVPPAMAGDNAVRVRQQHGKGNGAGLLSRDEMAGLLRRRRGYLWCKRVFDLINATFQLILFSPLFLAATLAIKLYDRGPVFFRQQRITGGPGGPRYFRIFKFRTMVVDAEAMGAKITEQADPRITPVGVLMRRFKIDEIPQLINIVRGEMTFVGPRPQTLGYVEQFREHYELIHSVVPAGLTDLASIRFKDEGGILSAAEDPERIYIERIMPDKIRSQQEYVRRMSLALDMRILWLTIVRVFFRR